MSKFDTVRELKIPRGYVAHDGLLTHRPIMANKGGLSWYEAPVPKSYHLCQAQTVGINLNNEHIDRCPCGAIRVGKTGLWAQRNSRKGTRYAPSRWERLKVFLHQGKEDWRSASSTKKA